MVPKRKTTEIFSQRADLLIWFPYLYINKVEYQNTHLGKKSPKLSDNNICLEGVSYLYPVCTTKNDMLLYI